MALSVMKVKCKLDTKYHLAFLPLRKPVRLICIFLGSGTGSCVLGFSRGTAGSCCSTSPTLMAKTVFTMGPCNILASFNCDSSGTILAPQFQYNNLTLEARLGLLSGHNFPLGQVISNHGQSQGLFYKHSHYLLINLASHFLPFTYLQRHQAQSRILRLYCWLKRSSNLLL